MQQRQSGFTLIELMIVVAIVALLSAIALPAYSTYRKIAADNACQAEMKNYAQFSLAALHTDDTPEPVPRRACRLATDASAIGVAISGTPQLPGSRITTCDMNTATCSLAPL